MNWTRLQQRFVQWFLTYNVFLDDDDTGLEQSERILKHQRYATRLCLLLFFTLTIVTISNISPTLFE